MSKNISRRDFLKGMGAASLGLAVAPVSVLAEGVAYKAGTYTATARGYASFVTVTSAPGITPISRKC